jgi:hypothetical protein
MLTIGKTRVVFSRNYRQNKEEKRVFIGKTRVVSLLLKYF